MFSGGTTSMFVESTTGISEFTFYPLRELEYMVVDMETRGAGGIHSTQILRQLRHYGDTFSFIVDNADYFFLFLT